MTESDLARKVMALGEGHGVIFKLSDRYTKGVPDIIWTLQDQTWFWELKELPDEPGEQFPRLRARVMEDLVQFMTMRRLQRYSGGRAFYLAFDHAFRIFMTARPEDLMEGSHFYGTYNVNRELKRILENAMLVILEKRQ